MYLEIFFVYTQRFMDSSTTSQLPPKISSQPTRTLAQIWRRRLGFSVFPILVLVLAAWYGGYTRIFAVSAPYAPGATLDPACAPGDPNCTVQILPDQTTAAGKILSTNGTTTTWVNETGGTFDGSQIVSRSGLPGSGTAAGAGGTTLQDFIQNYFFPSTPPGASLSVSGGGTREVGASTSLVLNWGATKTTYSITGISISAASPATVCGRIGGGSISATGPGCGVTVSGNTQSGTVAATVPSNASGASTTFTISVTPATGSAVNATATLLYTNRVYYGVSQNDYMDSTGAFPDGTTLYTDVRALLGQPLQTVRTVATTQFTSPGTGYYVYFAWPATYEPAGNCAAVSSTTGSSVGTTNCFNSGGAAASVSTTTDLRQRLMSSFVNGSGATVAYELYRSHFVIAPSGTVYYQVQ